MRAADRSGRRKVQTSKAERSKSEERKEEKREEEKRLGRTKNDYKVEKTRREEKG